MAKTKKDKEENEAREAVAENKSDASETIAREIPIGDGEANKANESAELEVLEEVDPIQQLQARIVELEDQKLLALADMDNHRKRLARSAVYVQRKDLCQSSKQLVLAITQLYHE